VAYSSIHRYTHQGSTLRVGLIQ